ncbi:uncharacterized protein METZ01_LOCUS124745, partial [marine metagenome]
VTSSGITQFPTIVFSPVRRTFVKLYIPFEQLLVVAEKIID